MRQFWALLALGTFGFLAGTIGMAAESQQPREATTKVSAPSPGAYVVPWVHL